jgi:hypothetical protein
MILKRIETKGYKSLVDVRADLQPPVGWNTPYSLYSVKDKAP